MNDQKINTIELRNYLLMPGKTNEFIRYFEDHFISSQHELGGYILGEYKIAKEPDRFFWIRGFENMEERSRFLPAFYNGEVWTNTGPAANDMMLEWHHVHLLKPAFDDQFIDPAMFGKLKETVVVEFYSAKKGLLNELISFFNTRYIPLLAKIPAHHSCYWVTESRDNDFPRLPVIQDDHLFVSIGAFADELSYQRTRECIQKEQPGLDEFITGHESIILHPAHV